MRKLLYTIFVSVCLSSVLVALEPKAITKPLDAVQALGHEMSEMRHMLEIYAMIGTGVSFRLPKTQMRHSIALYEAVIDQIQARFADPEIQKQIEVSREGWQPVKKALETALQEQRASADEMKKEAIFIHGSIRKVIKAMESMKAYMLTKAQFKEIKALNAAIEIDASARRLSAHYAMWMWNVPDPTIEAHWQKGVSIYKASLALLEKSLFTQSASFQKLLAVAQKQLQLFEMMHEAAKRGVFAPVLIQIRAEKASEAATEMTEIILHR